MGADPKSVGAGGYVVIEYVVDLQNTAVVAVFLEVEIKGVPSVSLLVIYGYFVSSSSVQVVPAASGWVFGTATLILSETK